MGSSSGDFYNKLFKTFLKINNIERTMKEHLMLLKDSLGCWKTRFLSTWKLFQRIFVLICSIILLINTIAVHRSIKMKPVDVRSDSYTEYNEDSNEKVPKFKVGDHVSISEYKNIFAKGYTQNWSEVFVVSEIKNTVPWTYVISDLNGEKLMEVFMKKNWKILAKKNSE